MSKPRKPRPAALSQFRDKPGRRTVVLLADLPVEGRRQPLGAGRVVEASAARFTDLGADQVRDATRRDVAFAGHQLVRLDLEPTAAAEPDLATEPAPPPEPDLPTEPSPPADPA